MSLDVDLFAGPDGWGVGAGWLGLPSAVGVENDPWTCATRAAAGHLTLRASVPEVPLGPFRGKVRGLRASPPCTAFSLAGKQRGMDDLALIHRCLDAITTDLEFAHRVADEGGFNDPTSVLITEPLRWTLATEPEWVVCEQVPPAVEVWQHLARLLGLVGYSTWAGVLNAADYGVAQTRRRAFLLARRGGGPVLPPPATHTRDPQPSLFGDLRPWVSMAAALGWTGRVGFPRRNDTDDGGEYRARDFRTVDQPAFGVTEKARSWTRSEDDVPDVELDIDYRTGRPVETLDIDLPALADGLSERPYSRHYHDSAHHHLEDTISLQRRGGGAPPVDVIVDPCPTIAGEALAKGVWEVRDTRSPGLGGGTRVDSDKAHYKEWAEDRPATTVEGRPLIADPGANANRFNGATKSRNDGIRVELEDVLVLQSFPEDYPVQGPRTARFSQVGNAVPPRLAAHVLAAVAGLPAPEFPPDPWPARSLPSRT